MIDTATTDHPDEITYRIKSTRLESLTGRFEKIAKRARRIGCTPPTFETLRIEDEAETKVDKVTGKLEPTGKINRFHLVRLIGERPIIAGHKFVGTLEHNSEVGLILRAVPGEAIPAAYREADPTNCDHCKKRIRTRIETFIVEHIETKTFKQVGRQCVADFLGGVDPKTVLSLMECLGQASDLLGLYEGDEDDEHFGGGRHRELFDVIHVLGLTSALCRNIGWVPRSKEELWQNTATATLAIAYMTERNKERLFADRYGRVDYVEMAKYDRTDADMEIAEKALEWARGLSENGTELNDYLYNLTTIAKAEAVEPKHFGLTCSIVPAYNREQERLLGIERERKQFAASQHFGQIKKREIFTLTVTRYSTYESDFGVKHIFGFQDRAGNFAVWFGTHDGGMKLGGTYRVKATVKEHGEYKGIAQTVLTRVDVLTDLTDVPESEWVAQPETRKAKVKTTRDQLSDEQMETRRAAARRAVQTRRQRLALVTT